MKDNKLSFFNRQELLIHFELICLLGHKTDLFDELLGAIKLHLQSRDLVMHRDDDLRLYLADDLLCFLIIDGIGPSDGDHENVYVADIFYLCIGKLFLSQIAQMAQRHLFGCDDIDGVQTALGSLGLIMERGYAPDRDALALIFPRPADHERLRTDILGVVMIIMLMGDEYQVILG